MELLFGIVIGLLTAILFQITILILRDPIERTTKIIYQSIPQVKEKGEVIQAPTENELAQERIIEENKKHGRDTKLSEIIIG